MEKKRFEHREPSPQTKVKSYDLGSPDLNRLETCCSASRSNVMAQNESNHLDNEEHLSYLCVCEREKREDEIESESIDLAGGNNELGTH